MSDSTVSTSEKEMPAWAGPFLAAFETTGSITEAARTVNISRSAPHKLKARSPEFAAAWAEAEEVGTEALESAARKRAIDCSDTLLIFLLKARRPDKYRDKVSTDHSGAIDIRIIHEEADRDPASGSPSGPEGSSLEFK